MNDWYDFLMEYKWRFLSGGILAVILTIVGVFVFEHSATNTAKSFYLKFFKSSSDPNS